MHLAAAERQHAALTALIAAVGVRALKEASDDATK
jgi:hypothetical protein